MLLKALKRTFKAVRAANSKVSLLLDSGCKRTLSSENIGMRHGVLRISMPLNVSEHFEKKCLIMPIL